jgi:hypothetical protein|tara:strand:- start:452 stop:1378 length:927 start_codon:yes stop_codon:yes gene_type:complete
MIDINFYIEKAENIGGFWSFTQNWFDILTLVLTLLALWLAFWLGERGYRREKRDKNNEEEEIESLEHKLFTNNLIQLKSSIDKQVSALKEYKEKEDFSLTFISTVQVDFLQFINIKNIYKKYGFYDKEKLDKINDLFKELYQLYDFRESLRNSVRNYISRYTDLEPGFYRYRKIMYRNFFEIYHINIKDKVVNEDGSYKYLIEDNPFVNEFIPFIGRIHKDGDLKDKNGNLIRGKLIDKLIDPLITICGKYIPEESSAIEILDIANEVKSAWINMEAITNGHFNEIEGHISLLNSVNSKIEVFLELKS